MRWIVVVVVAMVTAAPAYAEARAEAQPAEECPAADRDGSLFHFHAPGPVATTLHVAAMAMIVADESLTLDIKNRVKIEPNGHETNPILGRHPSDARIVLYGASVIALHTALWYIAPEEIRPLLDVAAIVVEVPYVSGNLRA